MSLEQFASIATIVGTVVSIVTLVISSSILVKVRKLNIDDHSTEAKQIAKGSKNRQSIVQK